MYKKEQNIVFFGILLAKNAKIKMEINYIRNNKKRNKNKSFCESCIKLNNKIDRT